MILYNATKFRKWLVLILAICCIQLSYSQTILVSKSGQKILIAEDGSWSILNNAQEITSSGDITSKNSTSLDAFKAPSQGKYPLTALEKGKVDRLLHSFKSDEAQLLVNMEFYLTNLRKFKQELKTPSIKKDKAAKKSLKSKVKQTENAITKIEKSYNKSTDLIKESMMLLSGKTKNRTKVIAALINESSTDQLSNGMGGTIETNKKEELLEVDENLTTKGIKVTEKSYPTTFGISKSRNNRNNYDCEIVFDGYDESIGSKKKEVREDFFFGYSQERMKSYFKNDDFITCHAAVSKVGKHYFLTAKIRIKSKEAKKTYGILRANEKIRIELIDGTKVYCVNIIQDNGTVESYTGHTLYTGVFQINKDDLDLLQNKYLDNIGIIWSSGYEQYNIFNVDFLRNQLRCLRK